MIEIFIFMFFLSIWVFVCSHYISEKRAKRMVYNYVRKLPNNRQEVYVTIGKLIEIIELFLEGKKVQVFYLKYDDFWEFCGKKAENIFNLTHYFDDYHKLYVCIPNKHVECYSISDMQSILLILLEACGELYYSVVGIILSPDSKIECIDSYIDKYLETLELYEKYMLRDLFEYNIEFNEEIIKSYIIFNEFKLDN